MQPARNDPCPCGSGRKYKHCCMWKDHAGSGRRVPASAPGLREAAEENEQWQVDALPLAAYFTEVPDARAVVIFVAAGGLVIHHEVLERLRGEVEETAQALAAAIRQTISELDTRPERIVTRHPAVAVELEGLLEEVGLTVTQRRPLDEIDEFYARFSEDMGKSGPPLGSVHPQTWAGWQIGNEAVGALFESAASFRQARPWGRLTVEEALEVGFPEGYVRYVQVLGSEGIETGLSMFESMDDLALQFTTFGVEEWVDLLEGEVLTLLYEDEVRIPGAMRKEIREAGWPVADPEAYPYLIALGTPAGGVAERQVRDLARAMSGVARLVEAAAEEGFSIEDTGTDPWTDPESGLYLSHGFPAPVRDAWFDAMDMVTRADEMHTTGPEGSGVETAYRFVTPEEMEEVGAELRDLLARFETYLREVEGLGEQTVQTHVNNAEALVSFLSEMQGRSHRSFREYDLRLFLYDWYPRKWSATRTEATRLSAGLRRFFEFIEAEEGVHYPWAAELLEDRAEIVDRWDESPMGPFWNEDVQMWREEVYGELDRLVMLPDPGLGDEEEWGDYLGVDENKLLDELQDRWLLWRDELIREGTTDPEELRHELVARQRAWEDRAHPRFEGKTPVETILEERSEQPDPPEL